MAHLVIYENGHLAPSVTERVGSGKGVSNRPADVMLVSTLLKLNYARPGFPQPPGAKRVVVAGSKFTPEMKLFLDHAQTFLGHVKKANGIASPLPLQASRDQLFNYIVFSLFYGTWGPNYLTDDGSDTIDALTKLPYLHHLRSHILGSPLPDAGVTSETVQATPFSETRPANTDYPGSTQ